MSKRCASQAYLQLTSSLLCDATSQLTQKLYFRGSIPHISGVFGALWLCETLFCHGHGHRCCYDGCDNI